jgi:hypothetical protein
MFDLKLFAATPHIVLGSSISAISLCSAALEGNLGIDRLVSRCFCALHKFLHPLIHALLVNRGEKYGSIALCSDAAKTNQ